MERFMKNWAIALLFSVLVLLGGCGGGIETPATPPTPPPPTSTTSHDLQIFGNWQFNTESSVPGTPSLTIAGSLTQSGEAVSAKVHADGSNCFDRLATIGLTGTL